MLSIVRDHRSLCEKNVYLLSTTCAQVPLKKVCTWRALVVNMGNAPDTTHSLQVVTFFCPGAALQHQNTVCIHAHACMHAHRSNKVCNRMHMVKKQFQVLMQENCSTAAVMKGKSTWSPGVCPLCLKYACWQPPFQIDAR